VAALEAQMGAPGFWDDSERAAAVSGEHARASRRLEAFAALSADVGDLDALVEMAAEEESLQAEVEEQIASVEARLAELEEQPVLGQVRHRRRAGDRQCGSGGDRRPGLGGDGLADGDALG
jgi:protein subunit release factor A